MEPTRRSSLAVIAILLVLASSPANAGVARRRAAVTPVNEWTKYCASLSMDGAANGERILSIESAPRLRLLWSKTLNGPIASAPSVARGKVYVGDWGGTEWALHPATGAVIASADLGLTTVEHCNPAVLGISSSPAIEGNLLYVAGGDDGFYALDADTLKTVWRRSLGDNSAAGGYYGWCSPAVVGGKVLQGIASDCDDPFPRGALTALDPATGASIETAYFVPEGVVGGGIWTSPAVETGHRKIFVTTGSAHSFDDGDSFSMIRLDLDTLLIEDRWKLPHEDGYQWDADWGSSPTLFTDAAGRELVGAGQKDGGYYVFDRNDIESGPVWIAGIARSGEVPQNGDGTLSTAAFDGKRVYVGGGVPPDNSDETVLGSVCAVDPSDGKVLWRHTLSGPVIAPVAYANGLVFAVGGDSVVALDAETGSVLWSYKLKAWGFSGVAISQGHLYVGDLFGNIYCFSTDGD